ncbi:S41 family peptidase [Enterococcus saccharolyticus]|uniref:S41 family peptidase n=1 Tax=Enterococcus saccharolyticus TaxID=41997 RepID=UPI001E50A299|nr:S41 family peptidase [Enterococcus saccharolyticus]MCD5003338.1 S41 family peptidase [Enterococcus saccharolyticus]
MNKQIPFHRYIISLICVAIISGGGVYMLMNQATMSSSEEASQDELAKVHALYHTIQENYYKKVDKNALIEGALAGMTDALDDPYTTYLGKEAATELNNSLSDSFEGIGATLSLVEGIPEVAQAPIKGSPAEKAGLKLHDKILKVDKQETHGKELTDVVQTIRGKKGTDVTLTIERNQEQFDVTITRGEIPIASLQTEIDKQTHIGKIQIASFNESTAKELKEAIQDLRKKGATSFVIDLRQNPGGYLNQVEMMASMFLEDGQTIVKFATDDKVIGESKASKELDGEFKVKEPVAVLVDGGSASASEIFAAALKESADIPIIGTSTFGKGTVQTVSDFGDQSEIKMTVQKWLTPNEEWVNEKGLEPTIKADFPEYAYFPPLPKDRTLKKGDESETISNLNIFLNALGYETTGNTFNDTTEEAIRDFQAKKNITVTGEVNSETAVLIEIDVATQLQENDQIYNKAVEVLTESKE